MLVSSVLPHERILMSSFMLTLTNIRKRSFCFEVFVLKINYPLLYYITTDPEICPNPPGHENPKFGIKDPGAHMLNI